MLTGPVLSHSLCTDTTPTQWAQSGAGKWTRLRRSFKRLRRTTGTWFASSEVRTPGTFSWPLLLWILGSVFILMYKWNKSMLWKSCCARNFTYRRIFTHAVNKPLHCNCTEMTCFVCLVGYKYSQIYLNYFSSEAQIQLEAIQTLCDITLCWRIYTLNTLPLSEIVQQTLGLGYI